MFNSLQDIVKANELLMSVGGEDQLASIVANALEQTKELQERIDRALDYAKSAPSNSMHAQQMARILDGSISHEDEKAELEKTVPKEKMVFKKVPVPKRSKKTGADPYTHVPRPESALKGRTPEQRKAIRQWFNEQDIEAPLSGPLPSKFVEMYDAAQEELRKMRMNQHALKEQQSA